MIILTRQWSFCGVAISFVRRIKRHVLNVDVRNICKCVSFAYIENFYAYQVAIFIKIDNDAFLDLFRFGDESLFERDIDGIRSITIFNFHFVLPQSFTTALITRIPFVKGGQLPIFHLENRELSLVFKFRVKFKGFFML
jgi:hypothetical protein